MMNSLAQSNCSCCVSSNNQVQWQRHKTIMVYYEQSWTVCHGGKMLLGKNWRQFSKWFVCFAVYRPRQQLVMSRRSVNLAAIFLDIPRPNRLTST